MSKYSIKHVYKHIQMDMTTYTYQSPHSHRYDLVVLSDGCPFWARDNKRSIDIPKPVVELLRGVHHHVIDLVNPTTGCPVSR